jgi:hypothetical protein
VLDSAGNDDDDSYDGHDNVYDGCDDDDDIEYQLYYFFTFYPSVLLSD